MTLLLPHGSLLVVSIFFLLPALTANANPPAVVELLEDEASALARRLDNHPGQEPGVAVWEAKDRYTGVSSLRVTQIQRYCHVIPGWRFPVAENTKPGEYRYLRFAWKKVGGSGIMLQLCGNEYRAIHRYVAGPQVVPWAALSIADKSPAEWTVVTRDLFKDFGAFTLMGLAFTPQDGDAGLFDHIYLGRTVEDLDKVTTAALDKPDAKPLRAALEKAWDELASPDAAVYAPARFRLVAGRRETVSFLTERAGKTDLGEKETAHVRRLLHDLMDDSFDVRERTTEKLQGLGEKVVPLLQRELEQTKSAEVRSRLDRILRAQAEGEDQRRGLRVIRVLEQIGTPEAQRELGALAKRLRGDALREEAKSAAERLAAK